jgi:HK97 family phage major capsid protein
LLVEPSLIEVLRPWTFALQAGATQIANIRGDISIPRGTAANVATWAAENAQINRTAPVFDAVNPQPRRLGITTAYSKQLLAQSTLDIDNIIKDDMLRVIGIGVDSAALNGAGAASNMPTGILTLSANAVGAYNYNLRSPNQTFAGPATYASLMNFAGAIEDGNFENDGTFCFVTTPKVKARWKVIPMAVNYPKYLWQGRHDVCDGQFRGYVTKLLDTPLVNGVLFGKFSEMVVCQWSGLDLVTDPYSLADFFQIRVVINALFDVQYRHNLAFCNSTDSGAQ